MKKAKTMKRNIYSCVHLTRTSARQMSLDAICIPTRTTFLWGVSLIEEFGQFNTKLMESSCFDNKSFQFRTRGEASQPFIHSFTHSFKRNLQMSILLSRSAFFGSRTGNLLNFAENDQHGIPFMTLHIKIKSRFFFIVFSSVLASDLHFQLTKLYIQRS